MDQKFIERVIRIFKPNPTNDPVVTGYNNALIDVLQTVVYQETCSFSLRFQDAIVANGFNRIDFTPSTWAEMFSAYTRNEKLSVIKIFKDASGFGLKEAKDVFDYFHAHNSGATLTL